MNWLSPAAPLTRRGRLVRAALLVLCAAAATAALWWLCTVWPGVLYPETRVKPVGLFEDAKWTEPRKKSSDTAWYFIVVFLFLTYNFLQADSYDRYRKAKR